MSAPYAQFTGKLINFDLAISATIHSMFLIVQVHCISKTGLSYRTVTRFCRIQYTVLINQHPFHAKVVPSHIARTSISPIPFSLLGPPMCCGTLGRLNINRGVLEFSTKFKFQVAPMLMALMCLHLHKQQQGMLTFHLDDVLNFINSKQKPNMLRVRNRDLANLYNWLRNKNENRELFQIPPKELGGVLSQIL